MEKTNEIKGPRFRLEAVRRAAASAGAGSVSRRPAASGIVWGVLGWFCAGGLVCALLITLNHQRSARAAVSADLAPGLQVIRGSVDSRRQQVDAQQQSLGQSVNDQIKRQEDLTLRIKGLELSIRGLDPQVKTLERTAEALSEELAALRENRSVAAEGVEALEEELSELESVRNRLAAVYKRRFLAMKRVYESRKAARDPAALERFFRGQRHTVFAPAAGHAAAESFYALGRTQEALRLYREVRSEFPGSPYAEPSAVRVSEIEAGEPYRAPDEPIPFEPYRPQPRAVE